MLGLVHCIEEAYIWCTHSSVNWIRSVIRCSGKKGPFSVEPVRKSQSWSLILLFLMSLSVLTDDGNGSNFRNTYTQPWTMSIIISVNWISYRRSQWQRGLRHEMSSPARTLGSWVWIPLRHGCLSAFILCLCVGSGLATGWTSVQGVLPTKIKKLKWNTRSQMLYPPGGSNRNR
jgi:hypothetical protein